MFGGEEGRKTLEEEILDSCGHGVHGYVQAVQVNILIRKMTLLTIKASVSNLNNFIPISNPPPPFLRFAKFNKFSKEYPIYFKNVLFKDTISKTTGRLGNIPVYGL